MNSAVLDEKSVKSNVVGDSVRDLIIESAKDFKTSWVNLGQSLYSVWKDKMYRMWGYEKFENYVEQEVGLKKQLSMKLLKAYIFLEQNEPAYLKKEFKEERQAVNVPNYDGIDVLRQAKSSKDLTKDEYIKIKKDVFDKGKNVSEVKKELTSLMRERKQIDPEEERDNRNKASIKKLINALNMFSSDMETLKLLPNNILEDAKQLLDRLQSEVE